MGDPLPADWYPDPENAGLLRWWDGNKWTEQLRPATPGDAGSSSAFGPAAAFRPAGAAGPQAPGTAGAGGPGPEGAGGPRPEAVPPGPWLPPVGQLAQPVYETAEPRRPGRRRWLIGGGIGVIVLAAAAAVALLLTGAFSKPKPAPPRAAATAGAASAAASTAPSPAASTAPSPMALGAQVLDHRAGIGFRIPAAPGWQAIPQAALGRWTLGYRKLAQRGGKAVGGGPGTVWAEAESAPLPSSYRYAGPQDLRSDGVQYADQLAAARFPAAHRVQKLGVTRQGPKGHGTGQYVVKFRVSYPAARVSPGRVTSETAAVVIAGRGSRERPAVLFVTVPSTMDISIVPKIAASAVAISG